MAKAKKNVVEIIPEYQSVIKDTQKVLEENPEWRKRYAEYAELISKNIGFIQSARKNRFALTSSLSTYIITSKATSATKTLNLQLRHLGQRVANMKLTDDTITIDTAEFNNKNKQNFGCEITLSNELWSSPNAGKFRSFFHNLDSRKLPSRRNEHRLESLLLTEFSKSTKGALRNIRPVTIAGLRFSMPTPLKAADHSTVEYANDDGGGVDILARAGSGKYAKLCIIELKDENKESEPASDALKQAIKYTVFIRELLRSDAGEMWWKLFGFNSTGKNPISNSKSLILYAACAMPDKTDADIFEDIELPIDNDKIRLHYIYFDEDGNEIKKIRSSLPHSAPRKESK